MTAFAGIELSELDAETEAWHEYKDAIAPLEARTQWALRAIENLPLETWRAAKDAIEARYNYEAAIHRGKYNQVCEALGIKSVLK